MLAESFFFPNWEERCAASHAWPEESGDPEDLNSWRADWAHDGERTAHEWARQGHNEWEDSWGSGNGWGWAQWGVEGACAGQCEGWRSTQGQDDWSVGNEWAEEGQDTWCVANELAEDGKHDDAQRGWGLGAEGSPWADDGQDGWANDSGWEDWADWGNIEDESVSQARAWMKS